MIYKLKEYDIINFFFKFQTSKNYKNFILDIIGWLECELLEPTSEEE